MTNIKNIKGNRTGRGELRSRIHKALEKSFVQPARAAGKTQIRVTAGGLDRAMQGINRTRAICEALSDKQSLRSYGISLVTTDYRGNESTTRWFDLQILPPAC